MKLAILAWLAWEVAWISSGCIGRKYSSLSLERLRRFSWEVMKYSTNKSLSNGTILSSVLQQRRRNTVFFSIELPKLIVLKYSGDKGNSRVGINLLSNTNWPNEEQVKPRDSRLETLRKDKIQSKTSTGRSKRLIVGVAWYLVLLQFFKGTWQTFILEPKSVASFWKEDFLFLDRRRDRRTPKGNAGIMYWLKSLVR